MWSDDFHHQIRRALGGDFGGSFTDYDGTTESIATTVREGGLHQGRIEQGFGGPPGTDPSDIALPHIVFFLQNHDQMGNRTLGDRIHHRIDAAAYRAATVLFLLLPETPLLFMGQEWAASTPFQYFTDHNPELGRFVKDARKKSSDTCLAPRGDMTMATTAATGKRTKHELIEVLTATWPKNTRARSSTSTTQP